MTLEKDVTVAVYFLEKCTKILLKSATPATPSGAARRHKTAILLLSAWQRMPEFFTARRLIHECYTSLLDKVIAFHPDNGIREMLVIHLIVQLDIMMRRTHFQLESSTLFLLADQLDKPNWSVALKTIFLDFLSKNGFHKYTRLII